MGSRSRGPVEIAAGPEMDERKRLSKSQRHERILSDLRVSSTIRVAELAGDLQVSTETIRRDLDELKSRGLINRTYGGAVRPFAHEAAVSERYRMLTREREAIGGVASRLIKSGEVVLIGAGATTLHVVRRIAAEQKNITVITHCFDLIAVLATNPTITSIFCPGRYNSSEGFIYGPETVDFLEKFHANHAILGASGLTVDGPNDVNADAAAVYRAMMARAAKTIVVADHSKFGRPSLAIYARWKEIDTLITDHTPPEALARALKRNGVEVSVASGGIV
jgi:DeoR/GlpR family transcriptional regulator of sugar metabolism